MNGGEIDRINKKYKGKNLEDPKVLKQYHKEYETSVNKALSEISVPNSPSGRYQAKFVTSEKAGYWPQLVVTEVDKAEHADPMIIPLERDVDGFIIRVIKDKSVLKQGDPDTELYLRHYGVKGMKWGVRRTQKQLADSKAVTSKKGEARKQAIKDARSRDATRAAAVTKQQRAADVAKGKDKAKELVKLDKLKNERISNPDFVNSNYLTRGEKTIVGLSYVFLTPVGGLVAAGGSVGYRKAKESQQRSVRGS